MKVLRIAKGSVSVQYEPSAYASVGIVEGGMSAAWDGTGERVQDQSFRGASLPAKAWQRFVFALCQLCNVLC